MKFIHFHSLFLFLSFSLLCSLSLCPSHLLIFISLSLALLSPSFFLTLSFSIFFSSRSLSLSFVTLFFFLFFSSQRFDNKRSGTHKPFHGTIRSRFLERENNHSSETTVIDYEGEKEGGITFLNWSIICF